MLEDKEVIRSSSSSEYNNGSIESKELFKKASSVRIVHGNEVYILRITKGNKLILTK
jgi:hemin uptake protein HemP